MNEYGYERELKRVTLRPGVNDVQAVIRATLTQPPDISFLKDRVARLDVLFPSANKKISRQLKRLGDSGIATGLLFPARPGTCRALHETVNNLVEKQGVRLSGVTLWFEKNQPLSFFEHKALLEQLVRVRERFRVETGAGAYPARFLKTFIHDERLIEELTRPASVGNMMVAFDNDGNVSGEEPDVLEDLLIDDEIILEEGIDRVFMDLMIGLFKPFLATSYKKARHQYTVRSVHRHRHPLGFIAVDRTTATAHFIEIALVPGLSERYYAFLALQNLFALLPVDKYGWTSDKANYPSIRLLEKLGGGFYEATVKNKKRVQAEGFFRVDRAVSPPMQEALRQLKTEAREKYSEWLKRFNARTEEKQALINYLEAYRP